ncbi:DUF6712 family protein [Flectobacillus sp. BAB-3569]|uniref:DUF6712 family protein n=1 Tax=Flectobacillus sp. BAB-3569 TaxID=1509483 RepID=UPI000BA3495D|nr:DUF6712 family protein [Flectobacillus sp. BAB-3569]PAC27796.1 hypothetical protein BWI92_21525 [Flectobacillus sp. BAB-3569]
MNILNVIDLSETVQKYASTSGNFNKEAFAINVEDSEYMVRDIIGVAAYDAILSNDDSVPEIFKQLTTAIFCDALGNFAQTSGVLFSITGLKQGQGQESRAATDNSVEVLIASFQKRSQDALERMLELMETSNSTHLSGWKNSIYFTKLNDCIVKNAQELGDILSMNISRAIFSKMKRNLKSAQVRLIKQLNQNLVDKIMTDDGSDYVYLKEEYAQPYVANLAFGNSIIGLSATFEKQMFALLDNSSAQLSNRKKSLDKDSLEYYKNVFLNTADSKIKELIDELNQNADTYPEYEKTDYFSTTRLPKDLGKITLF